LPILVPEGTITSVLTVCPYIAIYSYQKGRLTSDCLSILAIYKTDISFFTISAYKYNVAECALALLVTLVINFAVVIVAARSIRDVSFDDPTGTRKRAIVDRPLQNAPEMLKDVLGVAAKGMFAAALLASGQSSTITGTYAGQFVMEGFLEIRINPVLRAFLTRSAAIVPSLLVILVAGDEYAEFLIIVSSVILFVQLPFALIPLVKFCGDPAIVGKLVLGPKTLLTMRVLCGGVVFANGT
jgi:NRAMP (natural resistance-associated macrophage protein)-like metal ion transporter